MTIRKGVVLCLALVLGGVLINASDPAAGAGASPVHPVQLKAISSRMSRGGASVVIEATGPAAYVATRPDPFTLLVDLRNVGAGGVTNRFTANAGSPINDVRVETAESMGVAVSRVHITLTQAVAHRVRSDRNRIVVDFDKASVPLVTAPASRRGVDAMAALRQAAVRPDPIAVLKQLAAAQTSNAAQAPSGQVFTATPGQQGTAPQNERRFTGNPVSLDFQGADLRAVLRTFSEISGLNIVIDPKVQGTVDVALRDVPWDQALDIILRANGLGWRLDGTIVRIAPVEVFTEEDRKVAQAADARSAAALLDTLSRQLSYAKGDEIAALLKAAKILSPRGDAYVDARTNTLIVRDLPGQLPQINALVDTLDKAQPQVEIEARIVQTNKTFARELGVQWGFMGRVDPALGNTTNLAFPNSGSLGGRTTGTQGSTDGATTNGTVPTAVNLAAQNATSAVGLSLGSINRAFNLDVALSALERTGNGRLLSTPRVSTQNNIEAEIAQGVQIPYQTTSNNTITTQFKDAALTLKVTPQITASNTVIMKISVDNGSVGDILPGGVSINTQRANTTVQVDDGQTTVIGGIYASQELTTNDRTPGLGSIPLLKWLFKRDHFDDKSTELLIFITPRIIK